jgi:hypothetical protein
MSPPRGGKRWSESEEDELLWEARSNLTVAEIAERHGRTEVSICARVAALVRDVREFDLSEANGYQQAFDWVRDELRKNAAGLLATQNARAERATGKPFVEEPSAQEPLGPSRRPAAPPKGTEIAEMWASITGEATELTRGAPELHVLAHVERELLLQAGRRLHHAYGRLALADWVLECDWPNVELLRITAAQVREQADEVRWTGVELLRAGMTKVRQGDREILLERLGLEGNGTTLAAIGQRLGVSGERIRQRQTRALKTLRVSDPGKVFRAWDHVHGVLLAALSSDDGTLDPALVLSFLDLTVPVAPHVVAVRVVAALCGRSTAEGLELATRVLELDRQRRNEREAELREEKRLGKLNARIRFLVENTDWPANADTPVLGGDLHPLRAPRATEGRSESGEWYAPSLNRLVGYESGVELWFAQHLEISTMVQTYCEQALEIPYHLYGIRRTYYPDFVVDLTNGRRLVIELKASVTDFSLYENIVKFDAATHFCHARGWGFVATDGYRTPDYLIRKEVTPAKESALVDVVESGAADWRTIRNLMLRHDITHAELAALVLRHKWFWQTAPYRLSTSLRQPAEWS